MDNCAINAVLKDHIVGVINSELEDHGFYGLKDAIFGAINV